MLPIQRYVLFGLAFAAICVVILMSRSDLESLRVFMNRFAVCKNASNFGAEVGGLIDTMHPSHLKTHGISSDIPTSDDLLACKYDLKKMSPYDARLLRCIRSQVAKPSPGRPLSFVDNRTHFSQFGESQFLDKHMKEKRNGFFIECGAFDGVRYSNSLFFERQRNWTGILIEANPLFHESLLRINRNAYVLSACLSPKLQPSHMQFKLGAEVGGLVDSMPPSHLKTFAGYLNSPPVEVNCYSLNSIMAAIEVSHVDLFSLDVEGAELLVLGTIDWNRLRIDRLIVEYGVFHHKDEELERLTNLRKFFNTTKLYKEVGTLNDFNVIFERIGL